jgi:hypothetical protein
VGRSLEILMNRQFDNLTSGFYQLSHATVCHKSSIEII